MINITLGGVVKQDIVSPGGPLVVRNEMGQFYKKELSDP